MKLLGDQTTLVLAGAWNPAILNPNWIGHHILGVPQGTSFQVNMLMPVQGVGGPVRMSFEGISITARPDALIFHLEPGNVEATAKSFLVARRILDTLPHTPIAAMGINFAFEVDPAEGQLVKTIEWAEDIGELLTGDPDAKITGKNWQLSLSSKGHLINVGFQSSAQGTSVSINHHYEVEGLAANAAKILSDEKLYAALWSATEGLMTSLIKGANA